MGVTISVPTLNDGVPDFERLFQLYDRLQDEGGQVTFTFSQCLFLRHAAVAFLGGLREMIRLNGGEVAIDRRSMQPDVRMNLIRNGFLTAEGPVVNRWDNVVPFRRDPIRGGQTVEKDVMGYLFDHLFDKDWVHLRPEIEGAVAGVICEIYANAFEHSRSEPGVFSCGQNYHGLGQIGFAIVDFGVGIPQTVRDYHHSLGRDDGPQTSFEAVQWALAPGHSGRMERRPGGIGLDSVRDFMRENHGFLEIHTHDVTCRVSPANIQFRSRPTFFPGTAVNLKFQAEGSKYLQFAREQ